MYNSKEEYRALKEEEQRIVGKDDYPIREDLLCQKLGASPSPTLPSFFHTCLEKMSGYRRKDV